MIWKDSNKLSSSFDTLDLSTLPDVLAQIKFIFEKLFSLTTIEVFLGLTKELDKYEGRESVVLRTDPINMSKKDLD